MSTQYKHSNEYGDICQETKATNEKRMGEELFQPDQSISVCSDKLKWDWHRSCSTQPWYDSRLQDVAVMVDVVSLL